MSRIAPQVTSGPWLVEFRASRCSHISVVPPPQTYVDIPSGAYGLSVVQNLPSREGMTKQISTYQAQKLALLFLA